MNDGSTPRYGHAPIPMKRIANKGDVHIVGEFAWSEENGKRYIAVALPGGDTSNGYVLNYLRVGGESNSPGVHWGWDGNEDAPTLTPSLHCIGHWHGWVRNGMLVEA